MKLPGIPDDALALENRAIGEKGEPTLFPAFEILQGCWRAGDRSRELGLHLLFLSWYMLVEPAPLTGWDETRVLRSDLVELFGRVHEYFAPLLSVDAEFLYIVGLMANVFPWGLGDDSTWERRSEAYRASYRRLCPQGLDPTAFDGRGAYGNYFGGQARVVDGF